MEGMIEEPQVERENKRRRHFSNDSDINPGYDMEMEHGLYTWIIPNATGEIQDALWLTSPSLSLGSDHFSTWDIKFYPLLEINGNPGMRFLLRRTGSGDEPEVLFVTFRFGIANSSVNKVWFQEYKKVPFKKLDCNGNHSSLFGYMKDFLEDCDDDTMTVFCELYVGSISVRDDSDNNGANEIDDLRLLSEDMTKAFTRQKHPGMLLKVANKRYHVHNHILSARSRVFAEMLKDRSRYLEYPDIDHTIMDTLIYFLYSGNLGLSLFNNHLAIGLYECAKTLDIAGLDKFLVPNRTFARMATYEEKCEFTWSVESFEARNVSIGHCIRSPEFSTSIDSGCAWYMAVYPRGVESEPEQVIIAVQPCMQSYEAVFMTVTVSILDLKGQPRYSKCLKKFVCSGITFTFPPFFQTSALGSSKNHLLPNDVLTVHCKVRVLNAKHLLHNLFETRTLYGDRSNFERLSRDFQTLYEKKDLKDFEFTVGIKTVKAHIGLLFARSRIANSHSLIERRQLFIPEFDRRIFQKMLFYLYTGTFGRINYQEAMELLSMAQIYKIRSLRAKCRHVLKSSLNLDSVFDVVLFAHRHTTGEDDLKNACLEYIRSNAKEAFQHRCWEFLKEWDTDLAQEITDFCTGVSYTKSVYRCFSRYINEVLLVSMIVATIFTLRRVSSVF